MQRVRIEFTIEPFVDAHPGVHVLAAWAVVESAGHALVNGPFSSVVEVDTTAAERLVADVVRESLSAGASRVAVQVERLDW
jgi:hypothetical protein